MPHAGEAAARTYWTTPAPWSWALAPKVTLTFGPVVLVMTKRASVTPSESPTLQLESKALGTVIDPAVSGTSRHWMVPLGEPPALALRMRSSTAPAAPPVHVTVKSPVRGTIRVDESEGCTPTGKAGICTEAVNAPTVAPAAETRSA